LCELLLGPEEEEKFGGEKEKEKEPETNRRTEKDGRLSGKGRKNRLP
jgi:hypothetical protein